MGDKVEHCYAPYDFGFAVRRFVKRVQPRMLVLMETELWPHLIGMTAATGAPVAMVNARLSERSAKGYTRVASLVYPMLQHLSWIACQTQDHRQRFAALGAPENRLTVAGNVKFDLQLPTDFSQTTQQLRTRLGIVDQPVWLAASTHEGEEALVLDSFSQLRKQLPDLLLLLVPRHPHRAAELMTQCQQQGWQVALQSSAEEGAQPDIWLGDVMGTLLNLYGVANVAFVGGSLVERGGHNPMEPAVAGTPMISGPHVFNFAQAYEQLGAADAVTLVQSGEELTVATEQLLANKAEASAQAEAAQQVVGANRGATDQLVAGIERLLDKTL